MKASRLLLSLFLISPLWLAGRTFTDQKGRTIEAELIEVGEETITIRRSDGFRFEIPIANLSEEDQEFARNASAEALKVESSEMPGPDVAQINQVFGIPLFSESVLWKETTEMVAERLIWPRESETGALSSYRLYPGEAFSILGARPYSVALYGEAGRSSAISMVFANKGDLQTLDRREIGKAIDRDNEVIEDRLTELLGRPERINMGRYATKERVSRWDWRGHSILLSEQDGEYLSLRVIPPESADNRGFSGRITDAEIRDRLREKVLRKPNGDVLIQGIPMVDQGPKGYCVPATFERYLRFMGIPADMYVLAMAGQTEIGGGTSIRKIVDNVSSYVAYAGRELLQKQMDLRIKGVADFIDEGIPIMWTMTSGKTYNILVSQRTKERQIQNDWSGWKERTDDEGDAAVKLSLNDPNSYHMCMIVGYNKETKELAVSDSWGEAFELRWIALGQAREVSAGVFHVIDL